MLSVGPCCTMLKETAPTSASCVTLQRFKWLSGQFVNEGQAHRHKGAACIFGVGIVRGANAPLPTQGSLEKGNSEEEFLRKSKSFSS